MRRLTNNTKGFQFEGQLSSLAERVRTNDKFAQHLYAALCNVDWQPTGGKHADDCMIVTKELPEATKKRVKVLKPDGSGGLTESLPDPWCNCGLAYSCSWRYAGGLIADLRNEGGDYLDYYCSGGEGRVTDDVRAALKELGWEPVPGTEGVPELHSLKMN